MHDKQLILTNHAYERYCQRVEMIDRDMLTKQLKQALKRSHRRTRDYIQIDGIWWRFGVTKDTVTFYTCYGEHHIDLPAAIRWAKRYKDRIDLGYED